MCHIFVSNLIIVKMGETRNTAPLEVYDVCHQTCSKLVSFFNSNPVDDVFMLIECYS